MEQKKKIEKTPEEKKGGNKGVLILLIIVVLALVGVVIYMNNQISELSTTVNDQTNTIEKNDNKISELTRDLESKIEEYKVLLKQYEAMELNTDSLAGVIAKLETDVTKFKNSSYSNKKEVDKLKKELELKLAEVNIDLAKKEEEIERYRLMADSLATEVNTLIEERGEMTGNINTLEEKVAIASILKAEKIVISSFNKKNKEFEGPEFKSKQVEKLQIAFSLADNKVAKKENKEVVIRIIEPSGSVLFDLSSGGGSFTNAEGRTDFYTSKQNLIFDNTKQRMVFFYTKGSDFMDGTYKIEIYADGFFIGEETFTIK